LHEYNILSLKIALSSKTDAVGVARWEA